ncbi:MAG: hypothetical protein A3E57_07290 [Candidatus Muproteobacteria bacterium RIFCSPHIGHO2_12_FULL_60_33]|nr:MAG: hypothetical protein A2W42_06270 [Candidatus Muproteobacteria bacterium RIFCSPHIGHO2_01_60_12]OGI54670.1 MAG: hypothetical protein A3D32_00095 [Candidatus Muproteobacteria bacterium RIFCSPHIGHO2_02_FULL_60_13]OGI56462.1 MAG: hypothetical protein A3E57_07290 [Candidatus Muproteobacteria bacterium RIFCSPHIGHO2_12_FULL_60_33]
MATDRKKGHFTFRTAAVLLMASAAWELLSITSEVPLFGEIRGGISAGISHLVYAALFLGLGIGLWSARRWGYTLVFVTTALYTLDKLQLILDRMALETFIKARMSGFESQLQSQGIDETLITQAIVLMAVVVVLCWWGFALYTWWRRDYFKDNG